MINDTSFWFELQKLLLVMWKFNGEPFSMGPIWFLPALFLGKLWLLVASRSKYMITIVVLGALLSLLFTRFTNIVLPFTIQQALTCAPFLLMGMKIREYKIFEKKFDIQILVSVGIACAVFAPLVRVAMFSNILTTFNYFSSAIISILLIFFLIEFETINNKPSRVVSDFLSWCGRYSLIILALHTIDYELHLISLPHNLWPIEILARCSSVVLASWLLIKLQPVRKLFGYS